MKKRYVALYVAFYMLFSTHAFSQVNYNDVAVIVNQNDSVSMAIGNYFMQQRNIPAINKITVNVPAVEEVSDSIFTVMRQQVENHITAHNLAPVLNYLVTTKGCPLKVMRNGNDSLNCNASVESELMLILGLYNYQIGNCLSSQQYNPYYRATENFSRLLYEIFLVTRLDGYTYQDIKNMIDRSGPNRFVSKSSSLFVMDQDPGWSAQSLNTELATVSQELINRGWQVELNTDTVFVTHQSNVLGYHSWGSNDGHAALYATNAKPQNTWLPGSLAETNVSTSARSFQTGTPYGQSLIADLIAEGVTGVKGYVYEPFTIAIARPAYLWNMYTDLDGSGHPLYNMAECFFAASQMIGWKDVVIGDPKTSITTDITFAAVSDLAQQAIAVFPNPAGEELRIDNIESNINDLSIYTMLGQKTSAVYLRNGRGESVTIDVSRLPAGIYFLQLTGEKERWVRKFVKE